MVGKNLKGIIDRDGVKHPVPAGGGGTDASIQEQLNEKATKVSPALEGHLAMYDENGDLGDGGAPSQFAAVNHGHVLIKCEGTGTNEGDSAAIVTGVNSIDIEIEKSGTLYNAEIDSTNFANLQRVLQDPAAPALGGTKLITNGQVFTALAGKMPNTLVALEISTNQNGSQSSELEQFVTHSRENELYPCQVTIDDQTPTICLGFVMWKDTSDATDHDAKKVLLYVGEYIFTENKSNTYGSSNDYWYGHWTKTSISTVLSSLD